MKSRALLRLQLLPERDFIGYKAAANSAGVQKNLNELIIIFSVFHANQVPV